MTFIEVLKNDNIGGIKFESKEEFDERKHDYENFVSDMESYILEKMNKEDFMQKYNLNDKEINDLFIINNKLNNLFFIKLFPYHGSPISEPPLQRPEGIGFPNLFGSLLNKDKEKAKFTLPEKFENDNKKGGPIVFRKDPKTGKIEKLSQTEVPDLLKDVMDTISNGEDSSFSIRKIELDDKTKKEITENFMEKIVDFDKNLEEMVESVSDYIHNCKENNIEIDQKEIDSLVDSSFSSSIGLTEYGEKLDLVKSIFDIIEEKSKNAVNDLIEDASEKLGKTDAVSLMDSLYKGSLDLLYKSIESVEERMKDASDAEISKYLDKDHSFILKFLSDLTAEIVLDQDMSIREKFQLLVDIAKEKIRVLKNGEDK